MNRILVVDDTPSNIKILNNLLCKDYRVSIATNGAEALEVAHSQLPDLILLDIMMPEMDGYEVCRRLKKDTTTNNIPIIFVTAKSELGDEQKGLQLGAVDYITKPFSPPITLARIRNHLDLKQVRDNLEQLVRERTAELQRKVVELEARDKLIRIQMQSADRPTVESEILSTVGMVIEPDWLCLVYPAKEKSANNTVLSAVHTVNGPASSGRIVSQPDEIALALAFKASQSGRVEQDEPYIASPACYQNETLAVLLAKTTVSDQADIDEKARALWRMSNEVAMVLQMTNFNEDLESGKVDFDALMNLAEKNL
ncbi:response regulator [Desulfopila sp. IMCC35008]|uniref:response regulator n=1 Tax=Desulfopila sp. IMCC35008 TaxID=2653858 RepID=UPI00197ADCF2|nr:response regulator [Desulfopila sp. IMCC35008]